MRSLHIASAIVGPVAAATVGVSNSQRHARVTDTAAADPPPPLTGTVLIFVFLIFNINNIINPLFKLVCIQHAMVVFAICM